MKKIALLFVAALFGWALLASSPVTSQGYKEKVRKNAKKIQNSYVVVLANEARIQSPAIWLTTWPGCTMEN